MPNDITKKIDKCIDRVSDKSVRLTNHVSNTIVKIQNANASMNRKILGYIIEKTFLRNYMFQMQIYERYSEQDGLSRVRKD